MKIPSLPQVEKLPGTVGLMIALLGVMEYGIWVHMTSFWVDV
jgi:hypothetical protein